MRAVVFSDSHGKYERMAEVFSRDKYDVVLFLGDGLSDLHRAGAQNHRFTVFSVRGNCDGQGGFLSALKAKDELSFNLGGINFLALHGHTRGVKSGMTNAIFAAREKEADVLLFGHTHEPLLTYLDAEEYNLTKPLYLFNPGSLASYSYGICEIRNNQILLSHGEFF